MRQIKFRGKRDKGECVGEWAYGELTQHDNLIWLEECNYFSGACVQPDTIGQFTGLHDANGKEIYEGDIVKVPFSESDRVGRLWVNDLPASLNGVVAWDESRACFFVEFPYYNKLNICACDFGLTQDKFEVIGNKYDNPELLTYNPHKG